MPSLSHKMDSILSPTPCNFDWHLVPQYFVHRHFVRAPRDMSHYRKSKYEISPKYPYPRQPTPPPFGKSCICLWSFIVILALIVLHYCRLINKCFNLRSMTCKIILLSYQCGTEVSFCSVLLLRKKCANNTQCLLNSALELRHKLLCCMCSGENNSKQFTPILTNPKPNRVCRITHEIQRPKSAIK